MTTHCMSSNGTLFLYLQQIYKTVWTRNYNKVRHTSLTRISRTALMNMQIRVIMSTMSCIDIKQHHMSIPYEVENQLSGLLSYLWHFGFHTSCLAIPHAPLTWTNVSGAVQAGWANWQTTSECVQVIILPNYNILLILVLTQTHSSWHPV